MNIVLTISTSVLGPAVQFHGNASFVNKPALGNFFSSSWAWYIIVGVQISSRVSKLLF